MQVLRNINMSWNKWTTNLFVISLVVAILELASFESSQQTLDDRIILQPSNDTVHTILHATGHSQSHCNIHAKLLKHITSIQCNYDIMTMVFVSQFYTALVGGGRGIHVAWQQFTPNFIKQNSQHRTGHCNWWWGEYYISRYHSDWRWGVNIYNNVSRYHQTTDPYKTITLLKFNYIQWFSTFCVLDKLHRNHIWQWVNITCK